MAEPSACLFICVDNKGYEASLELRKIHVALPDAAAEQLGQLRIVDESGEDSLYPGARFIATDLPSAARHAVLELA